MDRCVKATVHADSLRIFGGEERLRRLADALDTAQYPISERVSVDRMRADSAVVGQCVGAVLRIRPRLMQSATLFRLAEAFQEIGDTTDAIRYYRMLVDAAVTNGSDSAEARMAAGNEALLYWSQGKRGEAIAAQTVAVELYPPRKPDSSTEAGRDASRALDLELLGAFYEADNQWNNALSNYQGALAANPADTVPPIAIARILDSRAAAALDARLRRDPEWRVITTPGSNPVVAYDPTRTAVVQGVVEVWVKYAFARPKQVEPSGKPISQNIRHDVIDCSRRQIATISSAIYDSAGAVVSSSTVPDPTDAYSWRRVMQDVFPRSIGETELKGLCK